MDIRAGQALDAYRAVISGKVFNDQEPEPEDDSDVDSQDEPEEDFTGEDDAEV